MYEDINERVEAAVLFKNGQAIPHSFLWRGRKYKVDSINLEHREKRGNDTLLCFSVVSGATTYELLFDNHNLTWTLGKTWAGVE